ncbi:hypothetical protein [Sporisorium scitamineum]|nr:hypothetical protein [Sporisorium scitamineum]
MLVFSRIYRRRSAFNLAKSYQPWFPEGHEARDIYQTLVAADPPAPEAVLKAALLNRAMTDVRRIMRMRDDKQALGTLLQKGSIGDETMARFTLAEKELEAEILDVVSEANTFREGWGQLIFPTASEMVAHLKHKEVYYDIQRQRAAEVKKLEDAGKPVPKANVELPPLVTPPGTKIEIQGGPQGAAGPVPPEAGPGGPGGPGGPNGPGISLPMTGSGADARVTLPNGQQIHPAQLAALMQGPLPPNLPPQQAAMLMQARAQLVALQEQAQAQAQAQAQQQKSTVEAAESTTASSKTEAEGKAATAAVTPATKSATVEDGEDA